MGIWTVLLVGIGVSADAFAVSLTRGLKIRQLHLSQALLIGCAFGLFQGIGLHELLVLAVATSIDALAVGISLALLEVNIWLTATVIGVITFVLSTAAVFIGHRVGVRYQRPAEIIGGVILIGIGILVEHLSA